MKLAVGNQQVQRGLRRAVAPFRQDNVLDSISGLSGADLGPTTADRRADPILKWLTVFVLPPHRADHELARNMDGAACLDEGASRKQHRMDARLVLKDQTVVAVCPERALAENVQRSG